MSEWPVESLTDVLDFKEGPGILAVDFRRTGTPLVRLAGLKEGAGVLDGCNYLDPVAVGKRWAQFALESGDVLLSTSASLGEVKVADESAIGAIPYTGIIRFRTQDTNVLVQQFIPWMLRAPNFKRQVESMGVGSVMRHFGPMHLKNMYVDVPDIGSQRVIAEVLGALDDKIATNEKSAVISFNLAEAEFQTTWNTAPSVVSLGEVASLEYGRALPTAQRVPGTVPVYGSGGISGSHNVALVDGPGVIVGRKGTVGATYWSLKSFFPIDTTYYLMPKSSDTQLAYLFFAVRQMRLGQDSSDSAVPGVNRSFAYSHPVQVPLEKDSLAIEGRLRVLLGMCEQLKEESLGLAALRDALVPQLMSGKLRVKDVEKQLEDVV